MLAYAVDDIYAACRDYGERLPEGGELIYCADDAGASEVASAAAAARPATAQKRRNWASLPTASTRLPSFVAKAW